MYHALEENVGKLGSQLGCRLQARVGSPFVLVHKTSLTSTRICHSDASAPCKHSSSHSWISSLSGKTKISRQNQDQQAQPGFQLEIHCIVAGGWSGGRRLLRYGRMLGDRKMLGNGRLLRGGWLQSIGRLLGVGRLPRVKRQGTGLLGVRTLLGTGLLGV